MSFTVRTRSFTIMEVFAQFAGLERVLNIAGLAFSIALIQPIFMRKIVSELYLVKKDKNKDAGNNKTGFIPQGVARRTSFEKKREAQLAQNQIVTFMNEKETKDYQNMLKNMNKGKVKLLDIFHILGNVWRHRTTFDRVISYF